MAKPSRQEIAQQAEQLRREAHRQAQEAANLEAQRQAQAAEALARSIREKATRDN